MPDKKLTDNEIKKALECKIKFKCNECPYFHSFPCDKCHTMLKEVLDLINRQEAKLEAYQMDKEQMENDILNHQMNFEHSQAENESLKAEVERLKIAFINSQKTTKYWHNKCGELAEEIQTAKAEAYKKCLEKVGEIITEIYNKHIFGSNDLEAEEKDAIINFSDDVTYKLNNLLKELGVDGKEGET